MKGTVLDYNSNSSTGIISGSDGNRYEFDKIDWRDNSLPKKDQEVDFTFLSEEAKAKDIFVITNKEEENTSLILGLVAIAITFFFGFIGTFISRLAISKHSLSSALVPTLIHFLATFLLLIPIIGWLAYFAIDIYFMYKNYKFAINKGI